MKHPILLLCMLAALAGVSRAQDIPDSQYVPPPRPVNARVWTIHDSTSKGYLYDIRDSSLLLSREKHLPRFRDTSAPRGLSTFSYRDLNVVSTYRSGRVWKCVGWGFVIGAASGAFIGFSSGNDPKEYFISFTAAEKALGLGIFFGSLGAFTGLIVGAAGHHTFYIHGRKEKFDQMSRRLKARLAL